MIVRYTLANARRLGQTPAPAPMPAPAPAQPEAAPVVPAGPQPKWVNEDSNSLVRTLAAVSTVAALAIAGIYFFK